MSSLESQLFKKRIRWKLSSLESKKLFATQRLSERKINISEIGFMLHEVKLKHTSDKHFAAIVPI